MDVYKRTLIFICISFVCLSTKLNFRHDSETLPEMKNTFKSFSVFIGSSNSLVFSFHFCSEIRSVHLLQAFFANSQVAEKHFNLSRIFCYSDEIYISNCLMFLIPRVSKTILIPQKQTDPSPTVFSRANLGIRFSGVCNHKGLVDGVGRHSFCGSRSLLFLVVMVTLYLKRAFYLHGRYKRNRLASIRKGLIRNLRIQLVRHKVLRFYASRVLPLESKTQGLVFWGHKYICVHKKLANSKKFTFRVKMWIIGRGRSSSISSIAYLFILLILCGDVHPNPGPAIRPHRRHPQAESIVAAAWNVRTLLEKTRTHVRPTAVVSRVLNRYNIDVAALSETRILGESRIDEVGGGYTFFLKGKDPGERHLHGVGIAIRTSLLSLLNDKYPRGVNERLMTADLQLDGCTLTVISAYAPTLCNSDEDKELFYDQLNEVIKEVPAANKLLLLGDFNARVGTDYESWDGVLGHHGVGNENTNGTMLLSLCTRHQLTITNTLFNQEEQFITTWMHPGSKRWHLIDYAITRNRDLQDVLHTRAMCSPCAWSDHKLVKCKMALKTKKPVNHSKPKTVPKLNVAKLRSKEVSEQLAKRLSNANAEFAGTEDVETVWSKHKDLTLKIAKATLGPVRRTHKDWFDENNDAIKPLLDELHDLKVRQG